MQPLKVGLTDLASHQIGALSGGRIQRVLMARCMVQTVYTMMNHLAG